MGILGNLFKSKPDILNIVLEKIKSRYGVSEDYAGILTIAVVGKRYAQTISVHSDLPLDDNRAWITFSSSIGIVDTADIDEVLEVVSNSLCGSVRRSSGDYYYIAHTLLCDSTVSEEELLTTIEIVVDTAGYLEEKTRKNAAARREAAINNA